MFIPTRARVHETACCSVSAVLPSTVTATLAIVLILIPLSAIVVIVIVSVIIATIEVSVGISISINIRVTAFTVVVPEIAFFVVAVVVLDLMFAVVVLIAEIVVIFNAIHVYISGDSPTVASAFEHLVAPIQVSLRPNSDLHFFAYARPIFAIIVSIIIFMNRIFLLNYPLQLTVFFRRQFLCPPFIFYLIYYRFVMIYEFVDVVIVLLIVFIYVWPLTLDLRDQYSHTI